MVGRVGKLRRAKLIATAFTKCHEFSNQRPASESLIRRVSILTLDQESPQRRRMLHHPSKQWVSRRESTLYPMLKATPHGTDLAAQ